MAVCIYVDGGTNLIVPLSKEFCVHPQSALNPVNSPFSHQYLLSPVAEIMLAPCSLLLDYSHYFPTFSFHNSLI